MFPTTTSSQAASDFFKEAIISYTKQQFSHYSNIDNIIYSRDFDTDLLTPIYINLLSLLKNIIDNNKIWKLWSVVGEITSKCADEFISNTKKTINKPKREPNANKKIIFKDVELANINIFKLDIVSFCLSMCVNGISNNLIYQSDNDYMKQIIQKFSWLVPFCENKSEKVSYVNYIRNFLFKIPYIIESSNVKFNVRYIKWLHEVFMKSNINDDVLNKNIKEIIDSENNKNINAFTKLLQAPKETKPTRSRGASFDRTEFNTSNISNINANDKREEKNNYKLDKYFIIKKKKIDKKQSEIEIESSKDELKINSLLTHCQSQYFSINGNNNILINSNSNINNEDNFSQMSSSHFSLSKPSNLFYHCCTSISRFSSSSNVDDNLSYSQNYHCNGMSSRKSFIRDIPQINYHSGSKHKAKESSLRWKLKNRINEKFTSELSKNNENNINYNNYFKIKTKEEKMDSIKKFIQRNFYKNEKCDRDSDGNEERITFGGSEKDKERRKKGKGDNDVLVYKTPIKDKDKEGMFCDIKDGENDPTRRNLLDLFKQVNK